MILVEHERNYAINIRFKKNTTYLELSSFIVNQLQFRVFIYFGKANGRSLRVGSPLCEGNENHTKTDAHIEESMRFGNSHCLKLEHHFIYLSFLDCSNSAEY